MSHSIIQQWAGHRQLSELCCRTPTRSEIYLLVFPCPPPMGFLPLWPEMKLCKCTVIDPALKSLIFGESLPKSVHTTKDGWWAWNDTCFKTQPTLIQGTCFCVSTGIALRCKLKQRSIQTELMTTILGFQGVRMALLCRNTESCSQSSCYFSAF